MNQRKRTGSDTSSGIVVNGNGSAYDNDLDALKQDILKEVRKELYKIKAEIIDGKLMPYCTYLLTHFYEIGIPMC